MINGAHHAGRIKPKGIAGEAAGITKALKGG